MSYACVTTFGPAFYEKYGREAVATMARYWPGPVIAYGEGARPADLPERVEYRDLLLDAECANFIDWTGKCPFVQGRLPNGEYEYHYNMHKFGRKAFVISAMRRPFFFLGADVHILKPIPESFLAEMLEGKFGAFLFRPKPLHTESDFAGYNTNHPDWGRFAYAYRSIYTTGSVLMLLKESGGLHDCWSLDYLLEHTGLRAQCLDLVNGVRGDDPKGFHVWPKTRLAEYMVHLKGRIKKDPARKAEALKGAA